MIKNTLRPAGLLVALSLCVSPTVAAAATVPAANAPFASPSISPFVALSAYGTMQSQSAVCGAAVGTAAAAAVAGQAPAQGCVLPVVDPAAPVVVDQGMAPVAVAPEVRPGFGFGIGALIAGLIAVAGLAAVLLTKHDEGRLPISPD